MEGKTRYILLRGSGIGSAFLLLGSTYKAWQTGSIESLLPITVGAAGLVGTALLAHSPTTKTKKKYVLPDIENIENYERQIDEEDDLEQKIIEADPNLDQVSETEKQGGSAGSGRARITKSYKDQFGESNSSEPRDQTDRETITEEVSVEFQTLIELLEKIGGLVGKDFRDIPENIADGEDCLERINTVFQGEKFRTEREIVNDLNSSSEKIDELSVAARILANGKSEVIISDKGSFASYKSQIERGLNCLDEIEPLEEVLPKLDDLLKNYIEELERARKELNGIENSDQILSNSEEMESYVSELENEFNDVASHLEEVKEVKRKVETFLEELDQLKENSGSLDEIRQKLREYERGSKSVLDVIGGIETTRQISVSNLEDLRCVSVADYEECMLMNHDFEMGSRTREKPFEFRDEYAQIFKSIGEELRPYVSRMPSENINYTRENIDEGVFRFFEALNKILEESVAGPDQRVLGYQDLLQSRNLNSGIFGAIILSLISENFWSFYINFIIREGDSPPYLAPKRVVKDVSNSLSARLVAIDVKGEKKSAVNMITGSEQIVFCPDTGLSRRISSNTDVKFSNLEIYR